MYIWKCWRDTRRQFCNLLDDGSADRPGKKETAGQWNGSWGKRTAIRMGQSCGGLTTLSSSSSLRFGASGGGEEFA